MQAPTHETFRVEQHVQASARRIWEAYADAATRARWSVPDGELMVYDRSDFREGGHDRYRCGHPDQLGFHARVEYARIVHDAVIVYAETVTHDGQALATALVAWELEPEGEGTRVRITCQVASFVGDAMIDGYRNGHGKALEQLVRHLAADAG